MEKSEMLQGARPDWYLSRKAPNFGDYFGSVSSLAVGETYLTFDKKYIVHRSGETEFHVSRNSCAHAGAPILDAPGVQDVKELRCPIHKWTYDREGSLIAAPQFKLCPGVKLAKPSFSLWNGYLLGFDGTPTEAGLRDFGKTLNLPERAFNPAEFVFVGEERYDLRYPRELMMVNYFDGYHVPLYHQKTFAAVADCNSYEWELSNSCFTVNYSIQQVRARSDVERQQKMLMKVHGLKEEEVGWATLHLWLERELGDVSRPIDPEIFAVWASIYGNGCLMPELYEGGLFLAVSYLVNEDPKNPDTGNANLVEYYVHKNIPEARRPKAGRMFKHAHEQSAREDDEICETLFRAHQHGDLDFQRVYHETLEAGDVHWREWFLRDSSPR